ncbi:MAG TPA: hypothetical protein VGK27_11480 [Candidatus Deferrimicrobiaceae bacterium]|jgi:hypothetical protein
MDDFLRELFNVSPYRHVDWLGYLMAIGFIFIVRELWHKHKKEEVERADFHKQICGDVSYTEMLGRPLHPDVQEAVEQAARYSREDPGAVGFGFHVVERRGGRRK